MITYEYSLGAMDKHEQIYKQYLLVVRQADNNHRSTIRFEVVFLGIKLSAHETRKKPRHDLFIQFWEIFQAPFLLSVLVAYQSKK